MDKAILLVDDEAILLIALRQELRMKLGKAYRYETALSAADGLAAFDDLSRDGIHIVLVISDWLMPGMRGDEFLTKVHEKFPNVKTIMISGQTDESRVNKLRDSGSLNAFFRKPWDPELLIEECRKLLGEESPATGAEERSL